MKGISRRTVLKGVGATLGATALGCGTEVDRPGLGRVDGGPQSAQEDAAWPGRDAGGSDAAAAARCEDMGGLSAEQLLAPIDVFVVLMMENRSFDHYFGARRLVEGSSVDGLTGSESNPDPDGAPVPVHRLDDYTPADPPHEWTACHEQWNEGAN